MGAKKVCGKGKTGANGLDHSGIAPLTKIKTQRGESTAFSPRSD
jgi:hypothetical protein